MDVHRDAYAAVMKSFSLGELSWVSASHSAHRSTVPLRPPTPVNESMPDQLQCRGGDTAPAQPPC